MIASLSPLIPAREILLEWLWPLVMSTNGHFSGNFLRKNLSPAEFYQSTGINRAVNEANQMKREQLSSHGRTSDPEAFKSCGDEFLQTHEELLRGSNSEDARRDKVCIIINSTSPTSLNPSSASGQILSTSFSVPTTECGVIQPSPLSFFSAMVLLGPTVAVSLVTTAFSKAIYRGSLP